MKSFNLSNPASLSYPKSKIKQTNVALKELQARLPRNYPWQVAAAVVKDLTPCISTEAVDEFAQVISAEDVESLQSLGKTWSLQCMSSEDISPPELAGRYFMGALLKKYPFPDEGSEDLRINTAIKKFIKAEIGCSNYNRRGYKGFSEATDAYGKAVFVQARHWIQEVIGNELPDQGTLTLRSRHGPGASTNTKQGNTSAYFKYLEWPYDVTSACRDYAIAAISADERWLGALEDDYRRRYRISPTLILDRQVFWDKVLNVVPGNKITFVPKSYEEHRTIAIEPTMNLYLQLGVDGFMRRRLKRWLIDLDDQSRNQRFARLGSIVPDAHDAPCTLDLASASDSMALRLNRDLLPPAWYDYLIALRSPKGVLKCKNLHREFTYEKISSMGNGYTFALESLIFAAICFAITKIESGKYRPSLIAVYGDDLIVPGYMCDKTIAFLKRAGFSLNLEKSFFKGSARESCGADWFEGHPVRPVFLKTQPLNFTDIFNDRNRIYRWFMLRMGCTPHNVLKLFDKWIPPKFRIKGPISDEDMNSYLHSADNTNGLWKNGQYRFWRIVQKPDFFRGRRVNAFHIRKLMATLGQSPWYNKTPWDRLQDSHAGRSFQVHRPKSQYLALTHSAADFWRSEYTEPLDF